MITKTVFFDLSRDDRESDRRVLSGLMGTKDGSRVILFLGNRRYVTGEIHHLRTHIMALHLELQGQPDVVDAWEDALYERGSWGAA